MIRPTLRSTRLALLPLAGSLLLGGCASLGKKGEGGLIGAGVGGAAGAAIGHAIGSTTRGAIIGAVVGGAAGMVIGSRMDEQAKQIAQDIPGATVSRVGEGIAVSFASSLLYDVDSDQIRAEAGTNLRHLAESLGKYPNTDILIVGHTDATGTTSHNQALSERRATAATTYLAAQGVAATRLKASGRGELEPVGSNDTAEGRQANRRVEVAIVANAASRTSAP
ncbi:MAG: OmpA family protein [Gemmatimonadetes bacterium]|nr:OmpA family protein [Gemmatimonadota bacterium]